MSNKELQEGEEKLSSLKTFGSDYFKKSIFDRPKPVEKIVYGKNFLQIGRVVGSNRVYALDIKDSPRIIIIGSSGSGKSWLVRVLADRLRKIDEVVVHLNDTKNEFFSSKYPLQNKFHHLLLEGETPQGFPIISLRPTFFKTIDDKLAKDNVWYSVDGRDMSQADFMTLINSNEMSPQQRTALELLFQDIKKALDEDKTLELDYDLIESLIEENEDIDGRMKKSLRFKFKPLESAHFFEKENVRNVVNAIKNGYIPAINTENFDSFGEGSFLFPQVTLNMVLREIIKARRAKKIKRTWFFFDEASRFIGKSTDTSIRKSVIDSHDVERRYGIAWCTLWQSFTDIPDRIVQQSKYIFVPQTADVGTIKDILNSTGMVKNVQIANNTAIRLKRRLKSNKFSWVVFNRAESTMDLIIPLAPLSHHLEETKENNFL